MTSSARRKDPLDREQRDAAVRERGRNVLIDAGAGTGKTTTLVDRLVERLAPRDGGPAMEIGRVAAVTFTRRAAGELRLRIREKLLAELAGPGLAPERRTRLLEALAGLDGAYVGTIHSFADRLLRLRPAEAGLSPSYEIVEEDGDLVRETFGALVHGAETGTLGEALAGTPAAGRAAEAEATVVGALAAGLRAETDETGWHPRRGIDALVADFVRRRDVAPEDPGEPVFDAAAFRRRAKEFVDLAAEVPAGAEAEGCRWIRKTAGLLLRMKGEADPLVVYRAVVRQFDAHPRSDTGGDPTKSREFGGDEAAWKAWNAFNGDKRVTKVRDEPLRDDILAPLHRWMALRLVRLFPVVTALYEKVKARRRAVDQVDLLLKLRDLLAKRKDVRGFCQSLFDHLFIDEFQDTDPLQAEIVLYLCEREPRAERWEDVVLADGKLTLVGDPKQSIYRFRRADVAMYDRVRGMVAGRDHLEVRLQANFRSRPPLIEWFNERFARILGTSPDGRPFDAQTGQVYHQPLLAGLEGARSPQVRALAFDFPEGKAPADEYRALEAEALAKHLRVLVESREVRIADPLTRAERPVGYGDVAVLAFTTTNLPLLFPELDRAGVPYTAHGGRLFLSDPLHRQFILGLRAIADKDDGPAEASLLRPPFFAVDPADLVRWRAAPDAEDEPVRRVRAARERLRDLRQRRFERPPGATARDLLERTGLGRAAALGPNGAQVVLRLRELCLRLEELAADGRLDYDAATAEMRKWIDDPVELDPPHPVDAKAVRIMTVHQAKGLEFPVVVLWDGVARIAPRPDAGAWRIDREGRGWMIDLEDLSWEEPPGLGLAERERAYALAERRRLIYVAATRARDLLVVPAAGTPSKNHICGALLEESDPDLVAETGTYVAGAGAAWAAAATPPPEPSLSPAPDLEQDVAARWDAAAAEAARPRSVPVGVAPAAHAAVAGEEDETEAPAKERTGRFGPLFGEVVHEAIGRALRDRSLAPDAAARLAARDFGLTEHLDEAAADVARAIGALRRAGLLRPPGPDLRLEYPVAGEGDGGTLLRGYVDLLSASARGMDLIDFKTDPPPRGPVAEAYPAYVEQVRIYDRLLAGRLPAGGRIRCGLLFTADGSLHWLP